MLAADGQSGSRGSAETEGLRRSPEISMPVYDGGFGHLFTERLIFRIMPEMARTASLRDGWVQYAFGIGRARRQSP